MTDMQRAVERLTVEHTVHLDGNEYQCEPLIAQLREAISSSLGAGSGAGSGQAGGLLNTAAFTLYEHIDGIARGWTESLGWTGKGFLELHVLELPDLIQAAHARGDIDDDLRERLEAMFGQWVYQIEDLFDPPHEKELTAPCPTCGERFHIEGDTQQAAVVIPVKRGRAIIAECRCCGAMWATETDLLALADGMGIDVDFVALRELANATE